jgi:hypothetical protein
MKWDDLNGTGSKVWAVIWIDDEDFEDSNVEMWLADSEDHLYEQFIEFHEIDEIMMESFEEDWGYKILPNKVGDYIH